MENNKLCPLFSISNQCLSLCMKEACGWYDDFLHQCNFCHIGYLRNIKCALDDIYSKD